jgi:large subunit ribosomal protein L9
MDIAAALEKEGIAIDRRQITIEEPIKTLGIYTVPVKLHQEVTAPLKVWVVKE